MPKMQDTVPVPGSTFKMDEMCKCGSIVFRSRDGSDIECVKCGESFLGDGNYKGNIDRFCGASWRYDPIPSHATNI